MPGDCTNHLDDDKCGDGGEVVALMYEIGRRRGCDVDRHVWTVRRHENDTEPVPGDVAHEDYRDRRSGRTPR
jgi:hypothetical protein